MNVPIIMLHHVSDDPSHASLKPYSISTASFLRLLDFLEKHSIQTIGFKEFNEASRKRFFAKQVILSFDDCAKHLLDFAIPELVKRKMKAVFYMPTAHLAGQNDWDIEEGRTALNIMDADDLKYIKNVGMEIGAHGHEHVKMEALTIAEFQESITTSKKILEKILGEEIVSIAYPFGSVPVEYERVMKEVGYQFGLSIFHFKASNYALRRMIYHDGDSTKSLLFKMSFLYGFYRSFYDRKL